MKEIHSNLRYHGQRLYPYRIHLIISLIAVVVAIFGAYKIVSLKSETQTFAKPNKELNRKAIIQKYTDERFKDYTAEAAQHFKRHSKKIEDPGYALGHCNLNEAPSEEDGAQSGAKPRDWAPC